MSEQTKQALLSAAASSAMEGLPLNEEQLEVVENILAGGMTLQDYFEHIMNRCAEK